MLSPGCRVIPVKHFICVAFVLFSFVGYLQAEEVPRIIELRGHAPEIPDDVFGDGPKSNTVCSVAFSPDGKKVVTAAGDSSTIIWDTGTGKELHTLRKSSLVNDFGGTVAFSPDGKKILSSNPFATKIWDVDSGKELYELEGHPGVFSPDGEKIATGGSSRDTNTARIWNTDSGNELLKLEGHGDSVNAVAFSPDGKKVATGCGRRDHVLRIWDAESGELLQELYNAEAQRCNMPLAFLNEGKKIVAFSEKSVEDYFVTITLIWEVESGKILHKFDGRGFLLPDGKKMTFDTSGGFRIVDILSGNDFQKLEVPESFHDIIFSPDSKKVARMTNQYHSVRIFDVESGKELLRLELPKLDASHTIRSFAFSPDGKKIALGGGYGYVAIWVLE